jgi:hypothetical protein
VLDDVGRRVRDVAAAVDLRCALDDDTGAGAVMRRRAACALSSLACFCSTHMFVCLITNVF